jgi:hypothetical protein
MFVAMVGLAHSPGGVWSLRVEDFGNLGCMSNLMMILFLLLCM